MKKKIWLTFAGALSVAFAAAVIELDGYNIFDNADGGNMLCRVDPHCRRLQPGEIKLAKQFFGDTIDYKHVKVFTRPMLLTGTPENTVARMWNGNIYIYSEAAKVGDFSQSENLDNRKTYLHEMTHVWQYQNDPKFLESGFFNLLMHDFDYMSLYSYAIEDHKYLSGFNFEQQAVILETYYGLQASFRDKTSNLTMKRPAQYTRSFNGQTREECRILDQYAAVLSSALPLLSPEPKCAMYRPYQIPATNPAWDTP